MPKKKIKPIVETKIKETILFNLLKEVGADFLPQLYKKLGVKNVYFGYYTKIVDFLNKAGFKMLHPFCHVDKQGRVFNTKTGRFMVPNVRNCVSIRGKNYNVPKIMLHLFEHETIRKDSQIIYFDGNRKNLNINNIAYIREFKAKQVIVDYNNLMLCLRCYIPIPVKHVITDWIVTKLFLQQVVEKSEFFKLCECFNSPGFKVFMFGQVFRYWLYNPRSSEKETAKQFGISEKDCSYIINNHLDMLIKSIMSDLKKNNLTIIPFVKPKPKSIRKAFKEFEDLKAEILPDYKQKPYRVKNTATALAEFEALKAEIEAEIEKLKSKD